MAVEDLRVTGTVEVCLGSKAIFSDGVVEEMMLTPCKEASLKFRVCFYCKTCLSFQQLYKAN